MIQKKGREIDWVVVLSGAALLMVIAVVLASQRTELQPWYLLWVLPFVSLIPRKRFFLPFAIVSIGLLLHYVPFLYTGNWDPPIPIIKSALTAGSVLVAIHFGILDR